MSVFGRWLFVVTHLLTFCLCFFSTQMAVELDVFVGNTTIMDEEVYQLWLDGYTGTGHTLDLWCLWVTAPGDCGYK